MSAVAPTVGLNRALFPQQEQHSTAQHRAVEHDTEQHSTARNTKPNPTVQRLLACRLTGLGGWEEVRLGRRRRGAARLTVTSLPLPPNTRAHTCARRHTHTHAHTKRAMAREKKRKGEREKDPQAHLLLLYKESNPMAHLVSSHM